MHKIKSVSRSNLIFIIFSILLFASVVYYYSEIEKGFVLLEKVTGFWLFLALIAQALTYLATAIIYRIIIKGFNIRPLPHLRELYKVSIISLFFNQAVPIAGISGNTFIFNFLARLTGEISRIISVILLELLIFYLAMIIYIISFLLSGFQFKLPSPFPAILLGGLLVYLVFGGLVLLLGKKKGIESFISKSKKIKFIANYFEKIEKKLQITTGQEITLFPFIKQHKKLIAGIIFWQMLTIVTDAFTIFSLFYGLGLHISLFVTIQVLICTKIISILPIAPGGLILYESTMTYLFHVLGYPLSFAIMITILFRLLSFWLPMPVGYFLYHKWIKAGPNQSSAFLKN